MVEVGTEGSRLTLPSLFLASFSLRKVWFPQDPQGPSGGGRGWLKSRFLLAFPAGPFHFLSGSPELEV